MMYQRVSRRSLYHKRRERRHTGCHVRKHSPQVNGAERVGAVREHGPFARLVYGACPESYVLDPPWAQRSQSASPRGWPLPAAVAIVALPLRAVSTSPTQTDPHYSFGAVKIDYKKDFQDSAGGNASGLSMILRQKTIMPLPNSALPRLVWVMGCRCAKCWSPFPGLDRALLGLEMSKGAWGAYSSSRCRRGAHHSSFSVALSSPAAAAATTAVESTWPSGGVLASRLVHISSLPADRGSARRTSAATSAPPA